MYTPVVSYWLELAVVERLLCALPTYDIEDYAYWKMCFYVSTLECRIYLEQYPVYLSVLKLAPAEYRANAVDTKKEHEKLAVVVHVLQTTQKLVISRCRFAEDDKEMYQEL